MCERKKGFCLTGKESAFLWMTMFFISYFTPNYVFILIAPTILAIALFHYSSYDGHFTNDNAIIFFRNGMGPISVAYTNIRKTRRFKNLCILLLIEEQRVFIFFFSKLNTEKICHVFKNRR